MSAKPTAFGTTDVTYPRNSSSNRHLAFFATEAVKAGFPRVLTSPVEGGVADVGEVQRNVARFDFGGFEAGARRLRLGHNGQLQLDMSDSGSHCVRAAVALRGRSPAGVRWRAHGIAESGQRSPALNR